MTDDEKFILHIEDHFVDMTGSLDKLGGLGPMPGHGTKTKPHGNLPKPKPKPKKDK